MKLIVAVAALTVLALPRLAAAQGPPRDCALYVEIKGGNFTTPAKTTRTPCDFGGKLNVMVWNRDEESYTLSLRQFRFNTTNPGTCSATGTPGNAPLPRPNGTMVAEVNFPLGPNEVDTRQRKIKNRGANMSECFKYDIVLRDKNDIDIRTLDPELDVSEPPPPPPVKEGPAAPVKPKPPGR